MNLRGAQSAFSSGGRVVLAQALLLGALLNLLWETVHLPLYRTWTAASTGELAYAVLHCTAGDVFIFLLALLIALMLVGDSTWPSQRYVRVALAMACLGVGYAILSEWLNVQVFRTWAYAPEMPLIPPLGTGLSPLMQWLVIPPITLRLVRPSRSALARHDLDQSARHPAR